MSIGSLTYEQSVFKHCRSDKHLSQFYLQDGGKNSLGVDMELNYVTVTVSPYVYKHGQLWKAQMHSLCLTSISCR